MSEREIFNLIQFVIVLIGGIMTLASKRVSKFEFACCWIVLLMELL